MPRGVNDDVLAFGGAKPDLRSVNRNILVAFGLQRVHQIGPFERDAAPVSGGLQLLQFAFRQRAGIIKKPADKGGLAVVNMADNDNFKLFDGRGGWGVHFGSKDYMYPSRRSFSKASSLSLSCARPERSEVRVRRNSWITSATVRALDLMGKVQGAQPMLR